MKQARLNISPGFSRILDYPRFAGPTRMLILTADYFFEQSWKRAAAQLGWETTTVPSVITGNLTRDDVKALFTAVGEFKPHFVMASNYAGMDVEGLFARFFEDARIPYVSWFTDTPRMILYDRKLHLSDCAVAAVWERAYTGHLRSLGFQHVHFMPLATDPHIFNGDPATVFERDLGFVGISMIQLAAQAWEKLDDAVPEVARAVRAAFDEGRVTREAFAEGVERIVAPEILAQCSVRDRRHVELCMVYEATKRLRLGLAAALDHLGLEVRGDEEWTQVHSRCGGKVGYFDALAPFYRGTAINLNTTSLQMGSAVNQRVFDCPAAGGFLISDRQGDLDEFFDPDSEVVTYASLEELEDKVRYYLARPDERAALVRAAQRRIAAHHTHAHRLKALEVYLKSVYA
ncbi:MAG: glycosyltransferase [bacterium]|nr:glycosyltransferase [bacterium]